MAALPSTSLASKPSFAMAWKEGCSPPLLRLTESPKQTSSGFASGRHRKKRKPRPRSTPPCHFRNRRTNPAPLETADRRHHQHRLSWNLPGVVIPAFDQYPDVSVISNPEFLREAAAVRDFHEPSLVVVGGSDRHAKKSRICINRSASRRSSSLFAPLK